VWLLALMWSVAVSSGICRLVLREGFRDVSFRFGGRRTLVVLLAAMAYPVGIAVVAYGIAWGTGIAQYHTPPRGFLLGLLLAATVSTALNCLATTGEEIGWRGYMLTRLIDAGVRRPVLVSGLIWAAWHVPLIVTGVYEVNHGGSTIAGLAGFAMTTVSSAFVIARVRFETGSIWPPIVLHAAWNSVIQGAFDPATSGTGAGSTASCAAIRTGSGSAQACPRAVTPDRPASSRRQCSAAVPPNGLMTPTPVTITPRPATLFSSADAFRRESVRREAPFVLTRGRESSPRRR
jgi:membrane protease YdiL (CAAX protease family)